MTPEYQALREAVAETLRLRAYGPNGPAVAWREAAEPHRREWLAHADAVLAVVRAALQETTREMHMGAQATTGAIITRKHSAEIWHNMLAASALGGGHE